MLVGIGVVNVLAVWFILTYTTTYPLAIDEWIRNVPLTTLWLDGRLTVQHLISLQSPVVAAPPGPQMVSWLLSLPNVILLHWNLRLDAMLNYFLIVINAVLLLSLIGREGGRRWLLGIPVVALLLAVQQRYTLLVGAHKYFHMHILCAYLMLYALVCLRPTWRTLFMAMGAAFFATFSIFSGGIVWLVTLPFLAALGYRRAMIAAWLLGGALSLWLFVNLPGFTLNSEFYMTGGANPLILNRIVNGLLFVVTYIGGVFAAGPESALLPAMTLGAMAVGLFALNLWVLRRSSERRLILLCSVLALYGLLFGVLAAVGRADGYGVRGALLEHYIPFSVQIWIALSGMMALTFRHMLSRTTRPSFVMTANLVVLLLGTVFYGSAALETVKYAEAHRSFVAEAEQCIVETAAGQRDNTNGCLVVGGYALPEWIKSLAGHQLTGFAPKP